MDGPWNPDTSAVVNGIVYQILGEVEPGPLGQANDPKCRRFVALCRPKGIKIKYAKDYGPHPVWGENRRYVLIA